ncbi:aliphatic sulfonates family ABC transporter, periplasmic ligand-binding protein [Thermanaerovibrio acidaminovorans DSM 6589]|uniref:Aliphatic sulfonates family ABC transporter, periplasmic ligand-binding protein n=1 Tax=Thermanaerovibrio acidaminovorans (strain ATCC 49978 / DSM 6589 / Su883) TaxID=525903 RepID=D1B8N4_THEAS|nr:aliphatic sulfonate ABC transporter substrate-binding protein [Thermanaerovibrio acidaminovorans]ACZ18637.1 aliphatic sulfonates family ABC transporter, periplasmic ligand-binding protein [Thermanaerovibrio acidaminovorans DSM 6589]
MNVKLSRIFWALCVALALVGGPVGRSMAGDRVNITYVKAPLNVPSIVERHLGLFEKAFAPLGYRVDFPELTTGPQQTQAMAAGSVQVAHCLGGTSALLAAAGGVDLKIVGIYSRSPKAFVILVKDPSIRTVKDLKGRTVVGPKGTVLHQLLVAALRVHRLEQRDVEFLDMGIPNGVAALMAGRAHAALAAGPSVTRAVKEGARILTDGNGLVEGTTVIAMSGSFVREKPKLARLFLKTHRDALAWIRAHPMEAEEMTAKETGLSPQEVRSALPLYDFDPTIRASDLDELERTQDFLLDSGLMWRRVDLRTLVLRDL